VIGERPKYLALFTSDAADPYDPRTAALRPGSSAGQVARHADKLRHLDIHPPPHCTPLRSTNYSFHGMHHLETNPNNPQTATLVRDPLSSHDHAHAVLALKNAALQYPTRCDKKSHRAAEEEQD
jgi:hypothetical protein